MAVKPAAAVCGYGGAPTTPTLYTAGLRYEHRHGCAEMRIKSVVVNVRKRQARLPPDVTVADTELCNIIQQAPDDFITQSRC